MMKNHPNSCNDILPEGILLIDKSKGPTSFHVIAALRKRLGVKKIGHTGTLDPFATGVLVILVGRRYTKLSHDFICDDKEYEAEVRLGITTDTYDSEGALIAQSTLVPTPLEVQNALIQFQGEIEQVPPMYSAKKVKGKKLYELARKGITIHREPVKLQVKTTLIQYEYPFLNLKITCSKGTYIRSLAYDLGKVLGCGAYLHNLRRVRSGKFEIRDCINEKELYVPSYNLHEKLVNYF